MPLQLLLRHSAASREWSSRGSWDGREYPPTKKSTSSDRIQSPTNSMYRWPDQPNNTYIYPLTYMLAQEKERFWIFGDVFEATWSLSVNLRNVNRFTGIDGSLIEKKKKEKIKIFNLKKEIERHSFFFCRKQNIREYSILYNNNTLGIYNNSCKNYDRYYFYRWILLTIK